MAMRHPVEEAWRGIAIDINLSGKSYAHSVLNHYFTLLDLGVPSEEERRTGRATRYVHITDDEAWRESICLDCNLPLPLHPPQRAKRARKRYCKIATARRDQ